MSEKITLVLDAMGGDYAPREAVIGACIATESDPNLEIILTGNKAAIEAVMEEEGKEASRVSIVDCTEVIETAEHPVSAVRNKADSSLVVAMQLVKEGKAAGMLSAGNSGAILAGGNLVVGRLNGVQRPCLAPIIPTANGPSVLVDAGANMDARARWLVQWAKMGSIYARLMLDKKNPTVGIVNVGAEEEKGNKLVQEAFPLLKGVKDINFTGSVEAREISSGQADVIVCDAFVGNVILKMFEGVAKTMLGELKKSFTKSAKTKMGYLMVKKSLKENLDKFNPNAYGGAILLGCNGLLCKAHGNSKREQFAIAAKLLADLTRKDILSSIEESIALEENM